MSRDALKTVVSFLAGLLVTACVLGFWVGRNVPTAEQVDTLIGQMAETNFLLRAHGIDWEHLNHERSTDLATPAPANPGECDPGADCVGAVDD